MTTSLLGIILATTAVISTGYAAVAWAMARQPGESDLRPSCVNLVLRSSLAAGAGLAIWSASYALILFCAGAGAPWRIAKDAILAAVGVAGCAWHIRHNRSPIETVTASPPGPDRDPAAMLFGGICVLALFGSLALYCARYVITPNGAWDAWAIWNLRARFLARGGEDFATAFSPIITWTHPDYPLLLPGLVAQGWLIAGQESTTVPAAYGMAFMHMTIATLVSAVSEIKDSSTGFLAGIVLMGTPCFIKYAPTQCADIPLAAYELMACVSFVLACDSRSLHPRRLILLAGFMAGAAAWTKNEGLVFVVALATGIGLLPHLRSTREARPQRLLIRYLVGAAPLLLLLAFFKWKYAPANDVIEGAPQRLAAQWSDVRRHWTILTGFAQQCRAFGNWNYYFLILPFLAVACGCRRHLPTSLIPMLIAISMVMLGFYGAFLVTPHDIDWHLETSLDRLVLQVWPIVVLTLFLPMCRFDGCSGERGIRTPDRSLPAMPI